VQLKLLMMRSVPALSLGFLLPLVLPPVRAQEPGTQSPSSQGSGNSADIHAMADSIRALQAQVASLISQLGEVKAAQERTLQETRSLRRELDSARGRPAAPQPAGPSNYGIPENASVLGVTHPAVTQEHSAGSLSVSLTDSDIAARLATLDENQEFLDQKLGVQEQTKVESSSKYRVRLSGIALFSLYGNAGAVDNQDFPGIAEEQEDLSSGHAMGASLRQSQLGLEVFGPDIAGAHTRADLRFDFSGGFPDAPNGAATGIVRLRTGTLRLDWKDTSLIGGQDTFFLAPLSPTSLASLAAPPLSYSGNLWGWTPQLRVEHRFTVAENSSLLVQGGILDSFSGDVPSSGSERDPSWGEQSGQPAYAARVAWTQRTLGQQWTIGAGSLYARQFWGFGRSVDSWTSTLDLSLPLGRFFGLTGAFYRGRALGGFGGGVGQTVLFSGPLDAPASTVRGLNSMGGWAQLKFKPTSRFEVNTAFGQDNPFANELRSSAIVPSEYGNALSRNQTWFANFIYQLRSNVVFSLEFRRLKTKELDEESYFANHLNLAIGYVF
jgi:hypothetical protein